MDLSMLTVQELLKLSHSALQELRRRKVLSTANSPTGEYGEQLVCNILGWTREKNSKAGFDAIDSNKVRYEIKSRRLIEGKSSRKLSAIRNLEKEHFHNLVGVLFNEDFSFNKAIIIPHSIIKEYTSHYNHTNDSVFHLKDSVWSLPGTIDITEVVHNGLSKLDPMTMAKI